MLALLALPVMPVKPLMPDRRLALVYANFGDAVRLEFVRWRF
jgi:hypothetical protein